MLAKKRPHLPKKRPHLAKKKPCNFLLSLLSRACLSKERALEARFRRRRPRRHDGSDVASRGGQGLGGGGGSTLRGAVFVVVEGGWRGRGDVTLE